MKSNAGERSCWSRLLITVVFALQILVWQVALCRHWVTGGVLIETDACNLVPRILLYFFFLFLVGTWLKRKCMMTMEKKGNTPDAQILRLFPGGFKGDLRHNLQRTFDCACGVKERATFKMNSDAARTITTCIAYFPTLLTNALDILQSTIWNQITWKLLLSLIYFAPF